MKTFKVTIEETISQTFEVEAENLADAMNKAESKYKTGEFVLDNVTLLSTKITHVNDTIVDGWDGYEIF